MTGQREQSAGNTDSGVYFARADYIGLFKRFLIMMIDVPVVVGVALVLTVMCLNLVGQGAAEYAMLLPWLAWPWVYLVVVKRSSLRTLGYILLGARIVNLHGERPSLLMMTYRFVLLVGGPIHPLTDLLWVSGDVNRQALRDKLAGTYVIQRNATPAGTGPLHYTYLSVLLFSLMVPEVTRGQELRGLPTSG